MLKIPGGISAGIDHCEEISVFCRDEGGNPEVLGPAVSLREDHLAKGIRKMGSCLPKEGTGEKESNQNLRF